MNHWAWKTIPALKQLLGEASFKLYLFTMKFHLNQFVSLNSQLIFCPRTQYLWNYGNDVDVPIMAVIHGVITCQFCTNIRICISCQSGVFTNRHKSGLRSTCVCVCVCTCVGIGLVQFPILLHMCKFWRHLYLVWPAQNLLTNLSFFLIFLHLFFFLLVNYLPFFLLFILESLRVWSVTPFLETRFCEQETSEHEKMTTRTDGTWEQSRDIPIQQTEKFQASLNQHYLCRETEGIILFSNCCLSRLCCVEMKKHGSSRCGAQDAEYWINTSCFQGVTAAMCRRLHISILNLRAG